MNPSISLNNSRVSINVSGELLSATELWDSGLFWDANGLYWDTSTIINNPSIGITNETPFISAETPPISISVTSQRPLIRT